MNIFGVIVAGRLVKTDFAIHNEGEYVIELPDVTNINHIVVFLTGVQPLPHGFGASIGPRRKKPQVRPNGIIWDSLAMKNRALFFGLGRYI
uniref:DUF775 domain-containing protein n=1 Tax=Globodera pallida TaxID=36090 RepID=A0A183CIC6_GLOPA